MLFQVHFLSLLLEERGAGRHRRRWPSTCRQKLIRRHPHVFGEVEVETAGEVLRNWDAIKRAEPGREAGIFGEVPENLPGAAARAQGPAPRRLHRASTSTASPTTRSSGELEELEAAGDRARRASSTRSATCSSPRSTSRASCSVDPELALRAAAERFRGRVEAAEALAAAAGARLGRARPPDDKLAYYAQARLNEERAMSQIEKVHARQILD